MPVTILLVSPSSVVKVVQLPGLDVNPGAGVWVGVGVSDGDGVGGGVGLGVDAHPTKGIESINANPSVISNKAFLFMITSFWLKAPFIT
jgi:hypothetical protein